MQEGKAFLAANKDKEGVVETDSGLQYKILKSGEKAGKTPLVGTKCLCHYRGERDIADNGFTASTLVFMELHHWFYPLYISRRGWFTATFHLPVRSMCSFVRYVLSVCL